MAKDYSVKNLTKLKVYLQTVKNDNQSGKKSAK